MVEWKECLIFRVAIDWNPTSTNLKVGASISVKMS